MIFSQELEDSFNYGLFQPPLNGRAGKLMMIIVKMMVVMIIMIIMITMITDIVLLRKVPRRGTTSVRISFPGISWSS